MKIVFAGGGTAGHINPALAVADYIKERHPDAQILYVGTVNKLESKLVPEKGYDFFPIDVAGFEPQDALYGGYDGLSFYRAVSTGFFSAVRPGGCVIFECGAYQGFEVSEILKAAGYENIARHLDYNKMERAVSARVPMR